MEITETIRRLSLFGIPRGGTREVRAILARLVAARSISLGELQTARDIVERAAERVDDAAYIFLAAMFISQRGGNAFLRAGKGIALLVDGGYIEDAPDDDVSNGEYAAMVQSAWKAAISAAETLAGDVIMKKPASDGDCWYFQRNLAAVTAVSSALAARAADADGEAELSEAELKAATGFDGFELNEQQIEAVRRVVQKRFVVVTGGPGTGKTTVVCAMLRALMARALALDAIALAAPTGRAAQRMGEALREQCARSAGLDTDMRRKLETLDGITIHSLLGGSPPDWKYSQENRLPLKLVVVDESSMIDLHLMKALTAALPDDCRLVLLGDRDQLPSVETGAVLGDMVGMSEAPFVVRLTQSKRFTEDFARCADAVNSGDVDKFTAATSELAVNDSQWLSSFDDKITENRCFRCFFPGKMDLSVCRERFAAWAAYYGLLGDGRLVKLASDPMLKDDESLTDGVLSEKAEAIFSELNRSRVLTVVRNGPFGVHGINELLVKMRFDGRLPFNPLVKTGVPVMITRNTPSRRLFNGDVGVTVEGRSGIEVIFPRGDKVVSCPAGLLPEHELAYAMTVHKSQGSEFENVMVVLPDDKEHPLLNRQVVYTGITRAKKRAVIVGTESALRAALSRRIERDTGVSLDHMV